MSLAELKTNLHYLIDRANDIVMLEAIYELLSIADPVGDSNNQTSEQEKKRSND